MMNKQEAATAITAQMLYLGFADVTDISDDHDGGIHVEGRKDGYTGAVHVADFELSPHDEYTNEQIINQRAAAAVYAIEAEIAGKERADKAKRDAAVSEEMEAARQIRFNQMELDKQKLMEENRHLRVMADPTLKSKEGLNALSALIDHLKAQVDADER